MEIMKIIPFGSRESCIEMSRKCSAENSAKNGAKRFVVNLHFVNFGVMYWQIFDICPLNIENNGTL